MIDCFVPRNDDVCLSSLRGTKQSNEMLYINIIICHKKNATIENNCR